MVHHLLLGLIQSTAALRVRHAWFACPPHAVLHCLLRASTKRQRNWGENGRACLLLGSSYLLGPWCGDSGEGGAKYDIRFKKQ
jgi:hypothetical protein